MRSRVSDRREIAAPGRTPALILDFRSFDFERWTDKNYMDTVERYGLININRTLHLAPKVWFEPPTSSGGKLSTANQSSRAHPFAHVPFFQLPRQNRA